MTSNAHQRSDLALIAGNPTETCENELSVCWLTNTVDSVLQVVHIPTEDQLPKLIKATLWIPREMADKEVVLKCLEQYISEQR